METRPLSPHVGVEVIDLDVCEATTTTALELGVLLLRHGVVLLRTQAVDAAGQMHFSRYFGEPERMAEPDGERGRRAWSMGDYIRERPAAISILRADGDAPGGTATVLADMARALEGLPGGLRRQVDSLVAISATGLGHRLVRPHPLTREAVLSLDAGEITGIEGWERPKALNLIRHLCGHIEGIELSYRHRWRAGDMLICDNARIARKVCSPAAQLQRTRIAYGASLFWFMAAAQAASTPAGSGVLNSPGGR
jgi:taurine dioxygenase